MNRLIQELRRRHVIRSAVTYVVAAWVAVQGADLLVDPLSYQDLGGSRVDDTEGLEGSRFVLELQDPVPVGILEELPLVDQTCAISMRAVRTDAFGVQGGR